MLGFYRIIGLFDDVPVSKFMFLFIFVCTILYTCAPFNTNFMKKLKLFSILFFGYAILTIIMTYPVVFRLSSHFMCDGGDGFQNVWNIWWVKTSLTTGAHPYYTNLLHYPDGITLLFQTLNPFNGLISIPFQFFFNMDMVYNSVVLFSFVMSGVSMYYLVDYLLDRKSPAFVAGIVFTFCPFQFRAWTWSLAINYNGVDSTICIVSAENVSRR